MRSPWSVASVVLTASLLWAAAPSHASVDCGCPSTGDYVDPVQPAALNANVSGLSPHGKYQLTATSVPGSIQLTITKVSPPGPVLSLSVPNGSRWGFSPDDDRFSFHFLTGSIETTRLFDLTSPTPATWRWEGTSNPVSSRTMFSPNGVYLAYIWIDATPQTFMTLVNARTGEVQYQASPLPFLVATGGADALGLQSWGFSPDAEDRSFVWANVQGTQWVDLHLVNVPAKAEVMMETLLSISAFWQFSPCGDAFALVKQPNPSQANTSLYQTSDGVRIADRTDPDLNISLSTTATQHVALIGATTHNLAPNTAALACPANATLKTIKLTPSTVPSGTPTSGVATLTGPASAGGAFVALSYSRAEASGPASVLIPAGQVARGFTVATSDVPATTTVTVSGTMGATTKQAVLTLQPVPAALSYFYFPVNDVLGGTPVDAYLSLTKGAPVGGATVTLTSSNPAAATVDPSVLFLEGYDQAAIVVTTLSVEAIDSTVISAHYGAVTLTQKLIVRPVSLRALRLTEHCVSGGDSVYAEVQLDGRAGPNGAHIALSSDHPSVSVPDTCVIPPGEQFAMFGMATHTVTAPTLVHLTGAFRNAAVQESLTVFDHLDVTIRNLGTLYGQFDHSSGYGYYDHYSNGRHMNNHGDVVGDSETPDMRNGAFFFHGGALANLGRLEPYHSYIQAHAINDSGVAVGESEYDGVIFRNGTVTDVPLVDGVARDINNVGHIVGDGGGISWFHDGAVTSLGLLPGMLTSSPVAINDGDLVVGTTFDSLYTEHPFRWTAATGMVALPVPPGASRCYVQDVNNAGVIVGYCMIGFYEHAIEWQGTTITRLEGPGTSFLSVNNTGLTLGTIDGMPTIWRGPTSYDVRSAVQANCDVQLTHAFALNDLGQMTGEALIGLSTDDITHAVLITSKPTAPWMVIAAAVQASGRVLVAEPTAVAMQWDTQEILAAQSRVERSASGGPWTDAGAPSTDEAGRLTFHDTSLSPATDYRFRLAVREGGATRYAGMLDVRTPKQLALAIQGFHPNPAHADDLTLSFALPLAGSARIELFDVNGRRMVSQQTDALSAGVHELQLAPRERLSPGIYFARLSQAGRTATARVVIAR